MTGCQENGDRPLKRENPHKYLLYKPTFSQVMVFLASGMFQLYIYIHIFGFCTVLSYKRVTQFKLTFFIKYIEMYLNFETFQRKRFSPREAEDMMIPFLHLVHLMIREWVSTELCTVPRSRTVTVEILALPQVLSPHYGSLCRTQTSRHPQGRSTVTRALLLNSSSS